VEADHFQWPAILSRAVIHGAMFLANLCMAGMLVLVCLNVILRYAFGQPLYWGDEIMIYLMVLMVYLGFGYMLIEGRHVRMTALMERLTVRTQNIVWICTSLVSVVYFIFLLVAAVSMTIDSFQIDFISTITGLPIGPWQVVMCVGLAILLIASIYFTINKIRIARGLTDKARPKEHKTYE
jgi:TRAP-type C4-dicarboxylate transport system permease small subunit